jgi:hypothetical protein
MIQKYWKQRFVHSVTKKLVKNMVRRRKVTSAYVKGISFDALVAFVKDDGVKAATKAALQRIHMKVTFLHGSPPQTMMRPELVNISVFLAAFMIAFHPETVFSTMGVTEKRVFDAACRLLSSFEKVCDSILTPESDFLCFGQQVDFAVSKAFGLELFEYLKKFKEWKEPDEARLCVRIHKALSALYVARGRSDDKDTLVQEEFEHQIKRLRRVMARIEGEEALRRFDEGIAEKIATGLAERALSHIGQTITQEESAHALLLDATFELSEDGYNAEINGLASVAMRASRIIFFKEFWGAVEFDLKMVAPCYARVVRVLEELRGGIKEFGERSGIEEIIDLEFIRERTAKGAYSYQDAMNLVMVTAGIMMGMQTQARVAQMRECLVAFQAEASADKWAETLVSGLKLLMERLNLMRNDMANSKLRKIAITVQEHGIDYETNKFRDKVRDKSVVPARTMEWLTLVMSTMSEVSSRVSRITLHTRAMLSLLNAEQDLDETTVPETLTMDMHRINVYRHEFTFLIKAKTLLVLMGMERLPGTPLPPNYLEMRKEAVERVETTKAVLEMTDALEDLDLSQFVIPSMFESMVTMELGSGGPVRALMRTQLEAEIHKRTMNASGGKIPQTFFPKTTSLFRRTEKLISRFSKLAWINRAVHSHFYGNIIDHVLGTAHPCLPLVLEETFGIEMRD